MGVCATLGGWDQQGFMALNSAGIDCARHTLRLLPEVSPSFPLSQFQFLQSLLSRCIPTPYPALLSLGSLMDTQHWDFCIPWAMKDSSGQNLSRSRASSSLVLGWWEPSQAPFFSQQDLGHTRHSDTGCVTACRRTNGGSVGPQGCSTEHCAHVPTWLPTPQGYVHIFHHYRA